MKSAKQRTQHWDNKFKPETEKSCLDHLKPSMIQNATKAFNRMAATDTTTNAIINAAGIRATDRIKYHSAAREILRAVDAGLDGPALQDKLNNIIIKKYVTAGCDPAVLFKFVSAFSH